MYIIRPPPTSTRLAKDSARAVVASEQASAIRASNFTTMCFMVVRLSPSIHLLDVRQLLKSRPVYVSPHCLRLSTRRSGIFPHTHETVPVSPRLTPPQRRRRFETRTRVNSCLAHRRLGLPGIREPTV